MDGLAIFQGGDAQVGRHPERVEFLNVGPMADTPGIVFHDRCLGVPAHPLALRAIEVRSLWLEDHVLEIPRRLHERTTLLYHPQNRGILGGAVLQSSSTSSGVSP